MYHAPMRTSLRRLAMPLMAVAALTLGLSACSNSSSSTTTTSSVSTHSSLCDVVTPQQIAATTGVQVNQPVANPTKNSVTCIYKASDPSKSVLIEFVIQITVEQFEKQASTIDQTHPITKIDKLGEAAYTFSVPSAGPTVNTLVIAHGTSQIIITSTATTTELENLAQLILFAFTTQAQGEAA